MTGKSLNWKKICKILFGPYVQVHEDRNGPNTLEERTQGAICIGPTGNLQGNYNFFLLSSSKKITLGQLTEMPTPVIVIAEKQNEGLIFENRTSTTVNDILPDYEANEAFN